MPLIPGLYLQLITCKDNFNFINLQLYNIEFITVYHSIYTWTIYNSSKINHTVYLFTKAINGMFKSIIILQL